MASVAMKGGMPKRVIIRPLKAPAAAQSSTARTPPAVMPAALASRAPACSRMNQAAVTAARASRLPTERSMPPVRITSVMPMARMAMTAIWLAMLSRLSAFRKFGQR